MYFPSIACVQHYFDKRRSLAMGIAMSGTGAGTFAMAPLIEFLFEEIGWRMTLLAIGGIFLLLIPTSYLFKSIRNEKAADIEELGADESSVSTGKCSACLPSVQNFLKHSFDFSLLKNPFLCLYIGTYFLYFVGWFVPFSYIPDYAISLGISAQDASFLISIAGITNTLNRITAGFVADLQCINRLVLFAASAVISGIAVTAVPFCGTYTALAVDLAVYGMFAGNLN